MSSNRAMIVENIDSYAVIVAAVIVGLGEFGTGDVTDDPSDALGASAGSGDGSGDGIVGDGALLRLVRRVMTDNIL